MENNWNENKIKKTSAENKLELEELDRYHEAGHSVLCVLDGEIITRITIDPVGGSSIDTDFKLEELQYDEYFSNEDTRSQINRKIQTYYAGYYSEYGYLLAKGHEIDFNHFYTRKILDSNFSLKSTDFDFIRGILNKITGDEKNQNMIREEQKTNAKNFVKKYWKIIQKTAESLLETNDPVEIMKIINEHA